MDGAYEPRVPPTDSWLSASSVWSQHRATVKRRKHRCRMLARSDFRQLEFTYLPISAGLRLSKVH